MGSPGVGAGASLGTHAVHTASRRPHGEKCAPISEHNTACGMVSRAPVSGLCGSEASYGHTRSFTVQGVSACIAEDAPSRAMARTAASTLAASRAGCPSGPTTRRPPMRGAAAAIAPRYAASASSAATPPARLAPVLCPSR